MYDHHSLRKRLVTSPMTLIVGLVTAVGLWQVPYFAQPDSYYTLGLTLLTAYLMVNVVNGFGLIRERSRLTTTAMLVLLTLVSDTTHFTPHTLLPLLLVGAYACLLGSATSEAGGKASMHVFHAFSLLGIMVLIASLSVVVVVVAYVGLMLLQKGWRWRQLSASLLGLLWPAMAIATYAMWQPQAVAQAIQTQWEQLQALPWMHYEAVTVADVAIYGFIVLTSLPAMVHVAMDREEKRRHVQAMFGFFILLQLTLFAMVALLPAHATTWWPLLAVNSSPLLAHHLVLSRRAMTDMWFYVIMLLIVTAFVLTRVLWTDWLVFS